ncbi:hypothetical protein E2C01_094194 [Portunus trituberculatus]|uniref:Uncharacterized protein n=1 Tax=Portunus trituberculatus TaxID=210409 RepID=A0A5B7JL79_PORTR|nr:hypothetical protein [Portunus trituberculatus]
MVRADGRCGLSILTEILGPARDELIFCGQVCFFLPVFNSSGMAALPVLALPQPTTHSVFS